MPFTPMLALESHLQRLPWAVEFALHRQPNTAPTALRRLTP
ncbi:MAG: hypothetical protein U0641_15670 [Anaerolineae bacterium]